DGLDTRLMDIYGVSNNVAKPGVRLFEAWYEQPIGPFSIHAGLIAADQEFVLAEHSTVLLDATFGIVAMLSYNIGNPVYPVAAPGASLHYDSELVKLRAAFYANQVESHGIPQDVGGDGLFINEVEFLDMFKLGFWHHTTLGDGYYAIADKQLERYIGTFARVSYAPDSPLSVYADTGIRIGPGPLRKRDFASIGLAFARTEIGAQTIVEATYQYLVKGWLTMQPDAQLLLTRTGTAGVFALRAVVAL
ncbi:MAG TPA: carbohydrate porin, partial [Kofleriaceae bacterium]|nr:carbohydrate porin [Kofleriaceae bacterium]